MLLVEMRDGWCVMLTRANAGDAAKPKQYYSE